MLISESWHGIVPRGHLSLTMFAAHLQTVSNSYMERISLHIKTWYPASYYLPITQRLLETKDCLLDHDATSNHSRLITCIYLVNRIHSKPDTTPWRHTQSGNQDQNAQLLANLSQKWIEEEHWERNLHHNLRQSQHELLERIDPWTTLHMIYL